MPAFSVIRDARTDTTASASSATYFPVPQPWCCLLLSSLFTSARAQNCDAPTLCYSGQLLAPGSSSGSHTDAGPFSDLSGDVTILDLPGSPALAFFSVPFPCVLPLSAFGVYNEQCFSPHAPFCFDTAQGQLSRFPAWPRFAWMLLLPPVCLLARIASFFLARLTVKLLLRLLGVSQRKSTDQSKCYQMLRG